MGVLQDSVEEDVASVPGCGLCGSERVVRIAWACWNPDSGFWELESVLDQGYCQACDGETDFVWKRSEAPPSERVRHLNDLLRTRGAGNGTIVITRGIEEKGTGFVRQVVDAVRGFDGFGPDNDPYGEHDFGSLDVGDEKIFFKIDAYDLSMTCASPNPGNPALTKRVLTIMLAHEY